MTPAQLSTFKAAILAEPALAAARAGGDMGVIAAFYNANGTGTIWRPSVTPSELNTAIVWSEFLVLTQAQRDAYRAIIGGALDATNANIRAGFQAIFTGTSLANLSALAQRVPTRFEQLFTAAQVSAVFGQLVTVTDVAAALGS